MERKRARQREIEREREKEQQRQREKEQQRQRKEQQERDLELNKIIEKEKNNAIERENDLNKIKKMCNRKIIIKKLILKQNHSNIFNRSRNRAFDIQMSINSNSSRLSINDD